MQKVQAVKPVVKAPVLAKEKAKVLAYVNWVILSPEGDKILGSTKGFTLLDNEYLTREERALVELAAANDGVAVIPNVQLRVICHKEKTEKVDTSRIQLVK